MIVKIFKNKDNIKIDFWEKTYDLKYFSLFNAKIVFQKKTEDKDEEIILSNWDLIYINNRLRKII